MEEVLAGHIASEEVLLRRGRQMGLNLAHKHMALIVRTGPGPEDEVLIAPEDQRAFRKRERRIRTALQQVLEGSCPGSLILPKGDTVLILAHFEPSMGRYPARQKAAALGSAIRDSLVSDSGGAPVSVGIGDFYPSLPDLSKSYCEARKALEKGDKIFGRGHVTAHMNWDSTVFWGRAPKVRWRSSPQGSCTRFSSICLLYTSDAADE